jgi:hypothetical protein
MSIEHDVISELFIDVENGEEALKKLKAAHFKDPHCRAMYGHLKARTKPSRELVDIFTAEIKKTHKRDLKRQSESLMDQPKEKLGKRVADKAREFKNKAMKFLVRGKSGGGE